MIIDPKIPGAIDNIVMLLKQGELVAIPTETVYGLAADAFNSIAIEKIFAFKNRPKDRSLSVLIADKHQMKKWTSEISDEAWKLAEAFWPGPLTLVCPKTSHVLEVLTGNKKTVGLRVPKHPVALAILNAFGGGLAAPSANLFGKKGPRCIEEVVAYFPKEIWIVDGGTSTFGLASTVVNCAVSPPEILREGVLTAKEIFEVL